MIIELFGLPGSGKTYLAQNCFSDRQHAVVKCLGKFQQFFFALMFGLRKPLFFCYLKILLLKENWCKPSLLWHKYMMLLLPALAKEGKALFSKNSTAVIDQGLLQLALSIYERKIEEPDIKRILSFCARENRKITIVEANKSVREKRMGDRGRRARGFLGEKYLAQWTPVLEYNYEVVKNAIIGSGMKYVLIENNRNNMLNCPQRT